ncbi:hypothetical protein MLD38_023282 [Melastoma candidum]|uniref:Uncharacterized protein n=1 Tax=Melastoma candidum TaxID=119954 RepID=A0ACB9QN72_9MYRT|nr:hypothetical protein MLD38_023282 [Melastoma candidum]
MKKVRNAYVGIMMGCANSPGCRGPTVCAALEPTRLPRSFSTDSNPSNDRYRTFNSDDLKTPLRVAPCSDSRRADGASLSNNSSRATSTRTRARSRSVASRGAMGRIDEDEPCYF